LPVNSRAAGLGGKNGSVIEIRNPLPGRRVALLGGTTSFRDCLVAAGFLLRPHGIVHGICIRQYESAFADYIGVRHGYSFSAGRVALFAILQALGIGAGDEVIIQVPSHIVVANAIRYTGARPIFADSCRRTCNVDLAALERAITSRTRAIVLQHTFGLPADLDAVLGLGRDRGIDVIEDCVHALGSSYRGARVGSFGRASFFSTEETKTISTTMGGMAVTNDDALAQRMHRFQQQCAPPPIWLTVRHLTKLISYHLLTEPHLHRYARALYEMLGKRNLLPGPTTQQEAHGARPPRYEFRLSNAQAMLGLRQLRRLDANLAHREQIAAAFLNRLRELGFETPSPVHEASPAYVRVPVYVDDQQAAVTAVAPHAVLGTWFTSVLEEAADPRAGGYVPGFCPTAEALAGRLVNLPTHQRVSLSDVDAIVDALSLVRYGIRTAPPQCLKDG
jgi:perosamine synthetase